MAAAPIFLSNIKNCVAQLQNADGTNLVTLLSPGASGSRLKALNVSSDDTVTRVLQLWVTVAAVDYLVGEVVATLGAGSDGATKPINALNLNDLPGLQFDGAKSFMDIANGTVLKVKSKVAVTAGKKIQLFGEYGDI